MDTRPMIIVGAIVLFTFALEIGLLTALAAIPPSYEFLPNGDQVDKNAVNGNTQWVSSRPSFTPAVSDSVTETEYVLPIAPLNLLIDQSGDVWFSSFDSHAIGKLVTTTGQVFVYQRPGTGAVWGLKEDAQGNIWYTTQNEDSTASAGKFDPVALIFTEWRIPRFHWGIDIDSVANDVWFATSVDTPGIHRLTPATNSVTVWSSSVYSTVYDLKISPDRKIWFTLQGVSGDQGVGRLDPISEQIVMWSPPTPGSRPFRVLVDTLDEIWFTEYAPTTNSLAQLVPSSGLLREFSIPTPNSAPASLLRTEFKIWFTESGANTIASLEPLLGNPRTSTLSSTMISVTKSTFTVNPISHTVAAQVTQALIITASLPQIAMNGFTEMRLPTANGVPVGIVCDSAGYIWFADLGTNRLGRIATGQVVHIVYLPLAIRN